MCHKSHQTSSFSSLSLKSPPAKKTHMDILMTHNVVKWLVLWWNLSKNVAKCFGSWQLFDICRGHNFSLVVEIWIRVKRRNSGKSFLTIKNFEDFHQKKPNKWKILSLILWQRKDRVGIRLKISQLLTTAHFLWITFFKIRNIFGIHFFSADFKNFTNKRGFSYLTSEGRVEAMGGGWAPNGGCTEN